MISWSQFHLQCRLINKYIKKDHDIAESFTAIAKHDLVDIYATSTRKHKLPKDLLHKILSLKNADNPTLVLKALNIYGQMNLSFINDKPQRMRRISAYLTYVLVVFLIVSTIYKLFVLPGFVELFEALDTVLPSTSLWVIEHSDKAILLTLALLVLAWLVSAQIKNIFTFREGTEHSWTYKLFLPAKIKNTHQQVRTLIHFPLYQSGMKMIPLSETLYRFFDDEAYSDTEIATELTILLQSKMNELINHSEAFLQKIYLVIAVLIIFLLFEFLLGAYMPIFATGAVI